MTVALEKSMPHSERGRWSKDTEHNLTLHRDLTQPRLRLGGRWGRLGKRVK